ncbi:MAG TPA: 2OG-Fe(II) oxygenase [Thermoanaerobaculia bacterium]|nr:2OG-Fe(II) oxygenase [Thermoanaerobaculia bacterium]
MFTISDFFDPVTRQRILSELRDASANEATVYGGAKSVDTQVRRTKKVSASEGTRALVLRKLDERKGEIERQFGLETHAIEEPQFLRYTAGDFFVAHQDGNTPVIRDDTRFRKVSIVIFLSDRGDYDGGELQLHGKYPDFDVRESAPAEPGTLVAFPAETTHEVTPLARGERYTIVSWYRVTPPE